MKMRKNLIAYVIIFTLRVNHNPTLEAKEILDESRWDEINDLMDA